mmetsp:Transcript_34993/g.71435  ORF Transcript_34993/g.71435 Transcript_34993/m.71435 type:complete len:778 (-) Transcript_34993:47-2380(-)
MNFLIRRTSKKEYDGPAASSSVSEMAQDAYLDSYNRQQKKNMDSNSSISSRSVMSSSVASGRHKQSQSRHSDPSRKPSSKKSRDSQRNSTSSSSTSSRQRRSSDKQSQQQLASGISSRRTSQPVKNHLPAHAMSGRRTSSNNGSSSRKSHQDSRSSSGSGRDAAYSAQYQQKKQSLQIPMEHDGGILCVEPVPDANKSNINSKYRQGYDDGVTHRFLSGGTDGTVKLWEVYEPPLGSPDEEAANSVQLVPRLVKTYRGHRGYVHSIAILGTFDPLEHNGRQQLQHDDESCCTEMDDMSFSSSSYSPRRNSNEKKAFLNRRSSNESKQSLIKKFGRRKRDLFVTASRDNTLRIWELDNPNEHEEYFEDSSEEEEYNRSKKKDPLRKGKKLRGHGFAVNGGVLCACAVPSSSTSTMLDVEEDGMMSAGQFVSGGSDGVIRVWDVKGALNLEKAPKAGRYHTIQLQRLNPFSSHDNGASDEDESTVAASIRSGESSRGSGVAVTSVKCSHSQESNSIALFASYSDGSIRRYSPVNGSSRNGNVKSAIRWCLTSVFEGHQGAVTSLTLLTSPSLLPLLSPDDEEECSNDDTGTILISSCAQGVLRVWDALDARQGGDRLERSEKSEGSVPMREALWEIELNDDEAGGDNDCNDGGDRPPTSINVRSLVAPVGIISLTALNEGRVMAAGTTDGKIRLWDVSSGLYEGTYNLGAKVQCWSLAVLSEREFHRGYDEFGDLQIHNAGIIIAGDNRGRLRILRKTCMRTSTEGEAEDDEIDRIFQD